MTLNRGLACFRYNYAPGEYIAFVNTGGIRATIPTGPVTLDTIKNVVPFGNELRLVVANGTTIRAMLEHSVEANEPQGSFLVPLGLQFWWDPSAKPLERITRVEVRRHIRLTRRHRKPLHARCIAPRASLMVPPDR